MPSFKIIGLLVVEKKMVFIIYGHGGNLGNVTMTIYISFCSIFRRRFHIKFDFDWPSGCEKIFENGGQTHAGARVYYKLTL